MCVSELEVVWVKCDECVCALSTLLYGSLHKSLVQGGKILLNERRQGRRNRRWREKDRKERKHDWGKISCVVIILS